MSEPTTQYLVGHVIQVLRSLPAESVQCVTTSPPYWGLRKYAGEQDVVWGGDDKCAHEWGEKLTERVDTTGFQRNRKGLNKAAEFQDGNARSATTDNPPIQRESHFCQKCGAWKGGYGLEPTIEMYVEHTVLILGEIRRVLRKDGVVFWNIGDSYWGGKGASSQHWSANHQDRDTIEADQHHITSEYGETRPQDGKHDTLKPKDSCLIPFRVALAVQADGWWCRSDIVWSKPNPMPESVTDRPTKSHEYIFLFTKSAHYYWDADAVREMSVTKSMPGTNYTDTRETHGTGGGNTGFKAAFEKMKRGELMGRNIRSVWTITTHPYKGAHFATFPPKLVERCVMAGTSEKGCCPKCGSPWERVVERVVATSTVYPKTQAAHEARGGTGVPVGTVGKSGGGRIDGYSETLGWNPACKCHETKEKSSEFPRFTNGWFINNDHAIPVPCVVLDPFAGSGTTLQVSLGLRRDAIGIDISTEYKVLAEQRIAEWRTEQATPKRKSKARKPKPVAKQATLMEVA